ncbi:hypothetical protein [Actinomycetospora aeridis]|uniref:Uncharacterized protein n=1 Tax=Actinomycetospora aeridis TaxID=3129231 RepID=A0ABU8ND14_9PSEU
MSRHRMSAPDRDEVAVDDAPTGPVALPSPRVVLVTRTPADLIAPAGPSTPPDGVDGAPGAVAIPPRPVPRFDDRARAWADAPGEFARPWGAGRAARPPHAPVEAPRLLPPDPLDAADGWGPWPADPAIARPRSAPLPVVAPMAPVAPARRGTTALMIGTIVVLVVMLAVLGVALVRPDLVGLSGGPVFATGGEQAPGVAQVVPGTR